MGDWHDTIEQILKDYVKKDDLRKLRDKLSDEGHAKWNNSGTEAYGKVVKMIDKLLVKCN